MGGLLATISDEFKSLAGVLICFGATEKRKGIIAVIVEYLALNPAPFLDAVGAWKAQWRLEWIAAGG